MKRLLTALAAIAILSGAAGAGIVSAQPAAPPAAATASAMPPLEAYGRLPGLEQVVLSPDGSKLAYIAVVGDSRRMNVITVGGQALAAAGLGDQKIRDIMWADEDHILITTSVTGRLCNACDKAELFGATSYTISRRTFTQMMKDIEGSAGAYIGGPPYLRRVDGKDIVLVQGWLDEQQGYRAAQFRISPDTGLARVYDFNFGVMDEHGGVIAAEEHYADQGGRWRLITGAGAGVRELYAQSHVGLDAPELLGFGRAPNTVMLKVLDGGHWNYYEVNLDTGVKTPFATPEGAVPLFDPLTDHLLGVGGLVGNAWTFSFDDQSMAHAWAKVAASFRGKNPRVVSWTPDHKKAVILTDEGTGSYYLMNFEANTATPIGSQYPTIKPEQISETRYVTYKAADGTEIPAYLTLPRGRDPHGLPLVVFPHGGPHDRDGPGFNWWAQAMASRGYVVLQPQFRGSDGFGPAFMAAGYGEWGRKMQTDLSDGVRWLAGQGMIDPARVCIVGGSYGGYAAMAASSLEPGVYRCAVAVAGVSDLKRMLREEKDADAGLSNGLGVRFWRRYLGADSINDASLAAISPISLADRASAPILLIHGKDDTVVPYVHSDSYAKALQRAGKPVEMVTLQGEDHWLTRGATRLQMLQATVAFLEKHNPPN